MLAFRRAPKSHNTIWGRLCRFRGFFFGWFALKEKSSLGNNFSAKISYKYYGHGGAAKTNSTK